MGQSPCCGATVRAAHVRCTCHVSHWRPLTSLRHQRALRTRRGQRVPPTSPEARVFASRGARGGGAGREAAALRTPLTRITRQAIALSVGSGVAFRGGACCRHPPNLNQPARVRLRSDRTRRKRPHDFLSAQHLQSAQCLTQRSAVTNLPSACLRITFCSLNTFQRQVSCCVWRYDSCVEDKRTGRQSDPGPSFRPDLTLGEVT